MSRKMLLTVVAVGAGAYAVGQADPPARVEKVSGADSVVFAEVSFGERLEYSVGSVGSAIVASSVQRSVLDNKQTLKDMSKAIKSAKGSDGIRAREIVRKINYMDSLAIQNLHQGRPIQAMKQSMESKSLINAIRRNLNQGV